MLSAIFSCAVVGFCCFWNEVVRPAQYMTRALIGDQAYGLLATAVENYILDALCG